MRKSHVLVVDDHELYRKAVERVLRRAGHEVHTARDAAEAMQAVTAEAFDLVLCDVKMPGINGLELVRKIHEVQPDLPCIVITGYGGAEASLDALRAGAFWYLEKPLEQAHHDVLRRLVDQAIEHGRLKAQNRHLQSQLEGRYRFDNIVGTSEPLQKVLRRVERVAKAESTVLITGESGTGKELVARAVHYNSPRADQMFVTVNCGAIPEELLESELFGHVKGAFTNAVGAREGRFGAADGGTIFLDEIGDMSPNLQVKLLRVLQDRTFEPVGSSTTQRVDVRVVAATNQDLPRAIEEKRFREDLFFRLNVIPIEMPPLRERRDDLPLLIHHFLERSAKERGTPPTRVRDDAMALLLAHDWPGNVRELENLMERLVVLGDGEIGVEDLPPNLGPPALDPTTVPAALAPLPEEGVSFKDLVDQLERQLLEQALEQTQWNKNQAAKLIGLNRTTLIEKIKKKNLSPDKEDS